MATNDFKPFAIGSNANVVTQSDYEALATLTSGFQAGKASSAQVNKALRQGTVMASVLARFISEALSVDVLDNGDLDEIENNFIDAIFSKCNDKYFIKGNNLSEISSNSISLNSALTNLGFLGSNTNNGFVKIPMALNNSVVPLIIQWGSFTGVTADSGTDGVYENSNIGVSWPISFPNMVFAVITGGASDVPGTGKQEQSWNLGKSLNSGNFGIQCRAPNASMTGSYLCVGC